MPVPKDELTEVQYVPGSLPQGQFMAGLPTDGSIISVNAETAAVWIAAGYAKKASTAAPAAAVVAPSDDKEID
jgi:hypothetical protein